MVTRNMPRVQEIIFPVLRAEMPAVAFSSWVADVDKRTYPLVNVRRLGGLTAHVDRLELAVIEMTAFSRDGLVETENIYLDARKVIWDMVNKQTVVPGVGYLHSYFETFGPTPFDSPFDDTWRIQGLIQLGLRPPN